MNIETIPFFDSKYAIYEGESWNVILHRDNQAYLGTCIVFFKPRVTDDPLSLNEKEREELWTVIFPRLVAALGKAFQPDRINYAHLANGTHFVHWHIVPRYQKDPVRKFAGEIFKDEGTGPYYALTHIKKPAPEVMEKIFLEIKRNF